MTGLVLSGGKGSRLRPVMLGDHSEVGIRW